MNKIITAFIVISFLLHLLVYNFSCIFWPNTTEGFGECYSIAIGVTRSKLYYWCEVLFQVSICLYLCKDIKNKTTYKVIAYTIYELFFFNTTDAISYFGIFHLTSQILIINLAAYLLYLYDVWVNAPE